MAEKSQQPTAKRLREAREKGDVPKSAETISTAVFVGVCIAVTVGGAQIFARIEALFRLVFEASGAPPKVAACDGRYVFGGEAVGQDCTAISGWA